MLSCLHRPLRWLANKITSRYEEVLVLKLFNSCIRVTCAPSEKTRVLENPRGEREGLLEERLHPKTKTVSTGRCLFLTRHVRLLAYILSTQQA